MLEKLRKIVNNHVGVIELAEDLDIETVTEIFIRVNSAGAELSQADFAMSKIAANETYGGNMLRKAIDYFCHLAVAPEFFGRIEKGDKAFAASEFFPQMRWLKDVNDDIYDPTYTDMLRVRSRPSSGAASLPDLVALLSGRNFETKQYEEAIAEASFDELKQGMLRFINQTHFDRITMILRSAGFVTSDLIGGQNAVNFAYILYLRGRAENLPAADLERLVRRWYGMSILRGRYTGSPETAFDFDIRQIEARGLVAYCDAVIETELPESFWTGMLPQLMDTSSASSPYFLAYQAAQVKLGDKGFLSRDITVHDLLMNRSDVHHVFPRKHLKKQGLATRPVQPDRQLRAGPERNQHRHWRQGAGDLLQGAGRAVRGRQEEIRRHHRRHSIMRANLRMHCLPESLLDGEIPAYDDFLEEAAQADGAQDQAMVRDAVMIADLKPYPEYKESGLPWLGQVPRHWEMRAALWCLRAEPASVTTE